MVDHRKVDLFIVGQPKSGTTALAHQLGQHPDISMASLKEPNFFATDLVKESDEFHGKKSAEFLVRTQKQYDALFAHKKSAKIRAEASTAYLYSKDAARNIYKHNPNALIVMVLREPVALIHSLHMQYVNEANEDEPDFKKALQKEQLRKKGIGVPRTVRCPSYLLYSERVQFTEQIRRYREIFPSNQILLFSFDEYAHDNHKVYQSICKQLHIDASFMPDFSRVHDSKEPRYVHINRLLRHQLVRGTLHKTLGSGQYTKLQKRVEKLLFTHKKRQPVEQSHLLELREQFYNEVKMLSHETGRDFITEWGYEG